MRELSFKGLGLMMAYGADLQNEICCAFCESRSHWLSFVGDGLEWKGACVLALTGYEKRELWLTLKIFL